MKKIRILLLLVLTALAAVVLYNYPRLNIITGFAAKSVCSCTFEAGRDLASIEAGDNDIPPIYHATNKINYEEKSVSSTIFGFKKRTAFYREGLGCVLAENDNPPDFNKIPKRTSVESQGAYPYGDRVENDTVFAHVDYDLLKKSVKKVFDGQGVKAQRTRAVLVVHKNRIIAEHYADGFDNQSKFLGWSMTKSITSAIVGVMASEGRVALEQTSLFPEWEQDDRSKISLNNLLQMNSGLEWVEDYNTISDVTKMLFITNEMPEVQMKKKLVGSPGDSWNYSSGTTNLLSGFIRDQFDSHQAYLDYWYEKLIDRIGMKTMVVEADVNGNYIGSSYSWATARDWAKFGLLYLHEGNWNGDQVLSKEWVDYTKTPTNTSDGIYGAQFWLNAGGVYPDVPRDLYSCNGYQGQHVFIIPSKDVVIVRFGLAEDPVFNINSFLSEVLSAIQ